MAKLGKGVIYSESAVCLGLSKNQRKCETEECRALSPDMVCRDSEEPAPLKRGARLQRAER